MPLKALWHNFAKPKSELFRKDVKMWARNHFRFAQVRGDCWKIKQLKCLVLFFWCVKSKLFFSAWSSFHLDNKD